MLKKYKSKSCVSLSVILPTGGTTHISFNPVTGGGSVFYTDNAKIQAGLEKHPKFGKLFTLDGAVTKSKPLDKKLKNIEYPKAEKADPVQDQVSKDEATVTDDAKLKEVEMTCNDDAKDYLVDKFGISRTKLRNRTQIEEAGKAKGIKFVWV
jgi:hypothetical protein